MLNCTKVTPELLQELNKTYAPKGFFSDAHFIPWRRTRINKLVSILTPEWFKDKTVLELACGYGHIGAELKKLGAIVTFAEGNEQYISNLAENAGDSEIYILDQDLPWDMEKQFDLVIHWGILYHLNDWRRDLITSIKHGKIISLESEVLDCRDPNGEIKINEGWYDGAKNHVGTRVAVPLIEKVISEQGVRFTRHDDADLNAEYHVYDWPAGRYIKSNNPYTTGVERFWTIYNNA